MNKLENKLSSREVADMMEIRHDVLLKKIDGINTDFTDHKIVESKYWAESNYKDGSGKSNREFQVTKSGCEFLAHKTTGTKGNLFTDKYMDKFAAMESYIEQEQQQKPTCIEDVLISSLQEMKALKGEVQAIRKANDETKEEIQGIRDVVSINSTDWKSSCKALVIKIAAKLGGFNHIQDVYKEVYSMLEKRMGVQLSTRLTNKRRRMADEGVCKSKRDKLNYIDVINDDKKLIEGYVAITKELAIKYGI